jgi:hypothetical protein
LRILLAGTAIAVYLGALGLMVSSFTGRKSVAVAVIVIGFGVSTGIAVSVASAISTETIKHLLAFLSPTDAITLMVLLLFHEDANQTIFGNALPLTAYLVGIAATVALCCGVMYWRYVPED